MKQSDPTSVSCAASANITSALAPAGRRRLSVALGGGGGRGITHLGVLRAIAEYQLPIDRICGVSIGALAGAMFAISGDAADAAHEVLSFVRSPAFRKRQSQFFGHRPAQGHGVGPHGWLGRFKRIFRAHQSLTRAIRHSAVLPDKVLKHVVASLLPDIGIEETQLPMSVVAVDLKSGRRVVLEQGSLRDAIRASASIPGIFPPVPWGDMLLADIGVFESVPALTAKERSSDLTLAVDVSEDVAPVAGCKNILEVFGRVQHLAENEIRRQRLECADIVVRPSIGDRPWFDFSAPEELITMGYQATIKALAEIGVRKQVVASSV